MLRRIRKLLSLARDILLTLFSVWWILVGFLNFFFYPLLTVTFGHRPWSGNALWLNWAYLNDVYDLFFRNNPNHGISDVPPAYHIWMVCDDWHLFDHYAISCSAHISH